MIGETFEIFVSMEEFIENIFEEVQKVKNTGFNCYLSTMIDKYFKHLLSDISVAPSELILEYDLFDKDNFDYSWCNNKSAQMWFFDKFLKNLNLYLDGWDVDSNKKEYFLFFEKFIKLEDIYLLFKSYEGEDIVWSHEYILSQTELEHILLFAVLLKDGILKDKEFIKKNWVLKLDLKDENYKWLNI